MLLSCPLKWRHKGFPCLAFSLCARTSQKTAPPLQQVWVRPELVSVALLFVDGNRMNFTALSLLCLSFSLLDRSLVAVVVRIVFEQFSASTYSSSTAFKRRGSSSPSPEGPASSRRWVPTSSEEEGVPSTCITLSSAAAPSTLALSCR